MTLRIPKSMKGKSLSHHRSPKQEKETARRIGGSLVPGSGSGSFNRGDVRIKGVSVIECKTTMRKSFAVTREVIDKIDNAAIERSSIPAIYVELLSDKGNPTHTCYVVPEWAFEMLLNAYKERSR